MKLDTRETILPNGLRVATANMPHVESVTVGIWIGVGGRYESRRVSGLAHFIEHLLFKGTKSRTAKEISQAIEGRGGYFNAFTQEESTCYYARVTAEYVYDVLAILSDMYRHPRFDKVDIDKERGVIIEEIMMYQDQPHHLVQDKLGELMWPRHALGRPLIGTPGNILGFSRKEIVDFKSKKYVPRNTLVTFAGNIEHEGCVNRVSKLLGSISGKRAPTAASVNNTVKPIPLDILQKDIEQSHLALGVRVFGRHDRRRYALKLLSIILGENMSSRLFQVVREKHGLAYSVHSGTHFYEDTGALVISAGLDKTKTESAVRLIGKELTSLKQKAVGARELRRAKDYAIGQLRIGLESTVGQMMWLGEHLIGYDKCRQPEKLIKHLESVTAAEIQKLTRQIFKQEKWSMALVVPSKAEPLRREDLLNFL